MHPRLRECRWVAFQFLPMSAGFCQWPPPLILMKCTPPTRRGRREGSVTNVTMTAMTIWNLAINMLYMAPELFYTNGKISLPKYPWEDVYCDSQYTPSHKKIHTIKTFLKVFLTRNIFLCVQKLLQVLNLYQICKKVSYSYCYLVHLSPRSGGRDISAPLIRRWTTRRRAVSVPDISAPFPNFFIFFE